MNFDYIFETLLVLCGLFLAVKLLAGHAGQFFYPKDKKNEVDLDTLIERKKAMFRQQGLAPSTQTNSPPSNESKSENKETTRSSTERFYAGLLEQAKNDEGPSGSQYQDIKQILTLLGNMQWGAGKQFSALADSFSTQFRGPCTAEIVFKATKILHDQEAFCWGENKDRPLSYQQVVELIQLCSFLLLAIEAGRNRSGTWLKRVAKEEYLFPLMLAFGVELFFAQELGENIQAMTKSILAKREKFKFLASVSSTQVHSHIHKILLNKSRTQVTKQSEMTAQMLSHARKVDLLWDLEQDHLPGETEQARAARILRCDPDAGLDQIKLNYKSLAKHKHPDRLDLSGLDEQQRRVVDSNFGQIKQAYDFLLARKQRR